MYGQQPPHKLSTKEKLIHKVEEKITGHKQPSNQPSGFGGQNYSGNQYQNQNGPPHMNSQQGGGPFQQQGFQSNDSPFSHSEAHGHGGHGGFGGGHQGGMGSGPGGYQQHNAGGQGGGFEGGHHGGMGGGPGGPGGHQGGMGGGPGGPGGPGGHHGH